MTLQRNLSTLTFSSDNSNHAVDATGLSRRRFATLAGGLLTTGLLQAPTWAQAAELAPRPEDKLKPGQFIWQPEQAPDGPLVILVSLDEQRAYVYRDGKAIGISTISSGKDGHETPTGVFTILQKSRDHRSNLYNDAPMPFMQRLTWDGIALHGGAIPGHPASHGCVRLPQAFAEKIFAATKRGDTVVVSDARVSPAAIAYPAMLAPIGAQSADSGQRSTEELHAAIRNDEDFWDDNVAGAGPVSVLVSLPEQRVYVLRNGVVMGAAQLTTEAGLHFDGAVLLVMGDGETQQPSPLDPQHSSHNWASYPVAGKPPPLDDLERHLQAPPDFMRRLYAILKPGTTILVTSVPLNRRKALTRGAAPTERVLESLTGR